MSRRVPVSRPPTPRVIHYVDPATPAAPAVLMNTHQLAIQQKRQAARYAQWKQRQQAMYLRWKARQEAIAERDRKVRRFWLGFGAVLALGLLAGLAVVAWLVWQALAAVSLGVLAVPALIVLVAVLGVGGHRCITVVQHWH